MFQLLATLALSSPAEAGDWHVDAMLRTDVPVLLGVSGRVEAPQRLRASLSIGTLPGPYLDGIQWIATSAGWYDEVTASLIDAALKGSLLIRPELGFRPLPGHGWGFDAGYQLAALGGSLTPAETLGALGYEVTGDREAGDVAEVRANATLHMLTVGTGWEFVVARRLVLSVGVGGAFTVGSRTQIEGLESSDRRRPSAALDTAAAAGEAYLDDILRSYIHTPYVSLAAGYRFR